MAQQESEDCVVPEGRRKASQTRGVEPPGGGKAVPVKEAERQLLLPFTTAENLRPCRRADSTEAADLSAVDLHEEPKVEGKPWEVSPATMEEVVGRLNVALDEVDKNKGAPGPDGRTTAEVRKHWPGIRPKLAAALLRGTYQPGEIRRVWIPKAGGGERGLGIPDVIDRVVQVAVKLVLEPLYEPTFHRSSHGFRPGRSCHTAIAEASSYIEEGHDVVVDIDLESFFDRVPRQRLLARLALVVHDKRVLSLIDRMLKASVVLPDGVKVATSEGLPQGGPLSPLLSNVVLSELDDELDRRGLRFVRYADDANIYVRSERAGMRVMASITRFIEGRLRLKVNAKKSAVAPPDSRHFLGFRLAPREGAAPEVLLSERSEKRLRRRIAELTRRNYGETLSATIDRINQFLDGWSGFFGICTPGIEWVLRRADAHIRRRLRARKLKHWKRKRTIARNLTRLGVSKRVAWQRVYEGRRGDWALSRLNVVHRALPNAYFAKRGLVSLVDRFANAWANRCPMAAPAGVGYREVVTRPAAGVRKPAVPKSRM